MSHSQKNADREAAEAEAEASVANSRCQNSPRATTNAATMDKFFHSSFCGFPSAAICSDMNATVCVCCVCVFVCV